MIMIEEAVFGQFLTLVESLAGMAPPVSHQNHIRRELLKLLSRWDMQAPALLEAIRTREDVRQEFLNSVTINETYFFREQRHFDFLRATVLPQLSGLKRNLSFWSVSCSTGEEAVSLAVMAADYAASTADAANSGMRFVVHASDINDAVLARFRSGQFSLRSFRHDGSEYHNILRRYGSSRGDAATGSFVLDPVLLRSMHIFGVNICGQDPDGEHDDPLPEMVDVVFFRNTLLYMAMEKRPAIIDRLVQRMRLGGWLFLSSSEVPFVAHEELEIVEHSGLYCFRKREPTASTNKSQTAHARPPLPPEPAPAPGPAPAPPAPKNLDKQVAAVLESIHTGRVEEAESKLGALASAGLEAYIESFLQGQLLRTREEAAAAAAQFARSFALNPRFWPGRFYYALCIKDRDPQAALLEFRIIAGCEGVKDRDTGYTFLLDGFEPGLFAQIAQDWIDRLEAAAAQ